MAVDSLYHSLDFSLAPDLLLHHLAGAIAPQFGAEIVLIELDFGSRSLQTLWHQQPNLPEQLPENLQLIESLPHPAKACRHNKLTGTTYAHLQQFGIEAIALIPLPTGGLCWLGSRSSLPSLPKLEAAIIPPLTLTHETLKIRRENQAYQTRNEILRQINELTDTETNIQKLLKRAIATVAKYLEVDQAIAGLFKYANPLLARNDLKRCPDATMTLISENGKLPRQIPLKTTEICQQAWFNAPEVSTIEQRQGEPFPGLDQHQSFLIAPLMGGRTSEGSNNMVLGLLIWAQPTPRHWSVEEQQFTQFLAHKLSTAMIHQQSLRQVQSLVDERTAQLKWSLDVQAKLGAKMRQQIQQLRQLNVLKDEFLSTMSHELNTPLATMKLAVKMLKQPGRSPEKQATYLDILDQELIRESKLIKDLLKLQHFESEQFALKPQRLVLNPILEALRTEFNQRWQLLKGLQLDIQYFPASTAQKLQLETDEESLTNALSELLVNAGKYSAKDTTVTLEVEYLSKSPAQIQLRLRNEGSGIAADELDYIFEKFRRGSGVTDQAIPGTGLGLALVKALVEQLEGTIAVSSEPLPKSEHHETCFTMTFPQSMVGL
jgi:signal transduction histidine kinase